MINGIHVYVYALLKLTLFNIFINLRIFVAFLIRMHYDCDMFCRIYAILYVNESQQEISGFYFQIQIFRFLRAFVCMDCVCSFSVCVRVCV